MRDPDFAQQGVDGVVTAEKRVQAGFEDIAVPIAPRGELAAQNRPLLQDERGAPGVGEVLGGC